jgi:hypothetical protein
MKQITVLATYKKLPPNPRLQPTPASPASRGQAQPKLLKEQRRAVLLPRSRELRAGKSPALIARGAGAGAGFGQGSVRKRWNCFCIFLLKWYQKCGSGQAAPTREFFASEAPASQPKLLIEQIRAVLLPPLREGGREGRLTDAHRSEDRLSRQPLGAFLTSIIRK